MFERLHAKTYFDLYEHATKRNTDLLFMSLILRPSFVLFIWFIGSDSSLIKSEDSVLMFPLVCSHYHVVLLMIVLLVFLFCLCKFSFTLNHNQ